MALDVVVIGAGLGGLSAAISLAAQGARVQVVEASPRAGGKAGLAWHEGVSFDTGPSVLTLPHVLDALLQLAGTRLEHELTLRRPTPAFRYLYPDGVALDIHHDLERSLASVAATLGEAASNELADFLAYAQRIWELSAPVFVFGPAPGLHLLTRLGPAALLKFHHVDPFRDMWSAIRARVRSPHLQALLARYATYNGSDPRTAPATLNCISYVELGLGGYGVEGGVYALVEALVRVARGLGVQLRLGQPVRGIVLEGGRARGVQLEDGEALPADAVVCNADVAHLTEDLLPETGRRAASGAPSMSGWTCVLKARRRQGEHARVAHTVLFPADYLQEFVDIFDRGRPPEDPTIYLCAQEPCHGRAGWIAHEPVFLMANAPPVTEAAPRDCEALAARALARARAAGLLDADDAVVWSRDPAGLARSFPGSRGSLYGAASNGMWAAFRRPANRSPGVPGLYLASGSAHPGGGMPLCLQSGLEASKALLEDHALSTRRPA
ncbi:MAG: phytoene desaturase [Alphaproteobacteria bacterium]|nr:phytoene desaturase [Alphaproteobacteria bacterium]